MVLTDIKRQLEVDTSMSAFTATVLSTNWFDLGTVAEDIGSGRPMHMRVNVVTAPTGVGAVRFECVALPVQSLAELTNKTITLAASTTWTFSPSHPPVGTLFVLENTGGAVPGGVTEGATYVVLATINGTTTCTVALASAPTVAVNPGGAGTPTHTAYIVPQVLGGSGPIPIELLAANSAVTVALNPQPIIQGGPAVRWPNCYRYVFGRWTRTTIFPENAAPLVTASIAAGKWSAFLLDGPDSSGLCYPDGSNPA